MSIFDSISRLVSASVESALPIDLNNYNIHPNNKKIIFITQYHKSKNKSRDLEIIDSINRNINDPSINEVILFTEKISKQKIESKINLTEKVKLIESSKRITFSHVFNYISSNPAYNKDNSNIFLLSNSDCYFDKNLPTLKYINFEDRVKPLFLTMTRYEDFSGSLDIGRNPFVERWKDSEYDGGKTLSIKDYKKLPYLEPWSSDAWAFKLNTINWIKNSFSENDESKLLNIFKNLLPNKFNKFDKFNNELGTAMCEVLLVNDLLELGIDCKNIGLAGYIKCIHQHKSLYREKKNISKRIEEYIPGIVPDPSRGIIRTKENTINRNYRLISQKNWIDNPEREHSYSDFFVRNISEYLYIKPYEHKENLMFNFLSGKSKIRPNQNVKKNFHTDLNCKPFNPKDYEDKFKYITLITQFYPEENENRLNEIVRSIQYNINNPEINEIILLIEASADQEFDNCKSMFYNHDKVNFVLDSKRLSYQQAITYSKIHNNKESIYLLSNNDCFFTKDISLIKKVDMANGKRMLCFTRKDLTKDNIIIPAVETGVSKPHYKFSTEFEVNASEKFIEKKIIDIASQDAWAFSLNYSPSFDCEIPLGTFNCEAEFTINNHMSGIELFNLVKYCSCIHIHNTNFRRSSAVNTNTFFNPIFKTELTIENYINNTWRKRTPENYIDKDSLYQEYSDFLVLDFKKLL